MGYLCRDCIYLRWKTGFDFVKTKREKPKIVEAPVENLDLEQPTVPPVESSEGSEETADIIKNVNWQQVFSFAGISVGQRST